MALVSAFSHQLVLFAPFGPRSSWAMPVATINPATKTLARIEEGLRRFGGAAAEPFLVVLRNHCSAASLGQPLGTVRVSGGAVAGVTCIGRNAVALAQLEQVAANDVAPGDVAFGLALLRQPGHRGGALARPELPS